MNLQDGLARGRFAAQRSRVDIALSRWHNRRMDREPFLIVAGLSKTVGKNAKRRIDLLVCVIDEDEDVLGLIIEEETPDPNGLTEGKYKVVEEYPVFARRPMNDPILLNFLPIAVRKGGERMSEREWDEYVCDSNIPQAAWKASLPRMCVSIPGRNGTTVRVTAYDRAGHKSESVEIPVQAYLLDGSW